MDTALTILLLVVLFILVFTIPVIRLKRALRTVIKIFRETGTVDAAHAKTSFELKLNPKSFTERLFSLRDFKPDALKVLIETRIVRVTEDEKLFLSEKALAESKLSRFARHD